MPRTRKSKHTARKTYRNRNRNHKRQRGGELTLMNKYAYNEDVFDASKQDFLDLIEIDEEYLNKDVFFDKIKTTIKSLSTDNAFLTELDTLMKDDTLEDLEEKTSVLDDILYGRETIKKLAAIVYLGAPIDHDRLNDDKYYGVYTGTLVSLFKYFSSLPEFNQRRAEQRKNTYVGLQGQGGLPANVAREVASYL